MSGSEISTRVPYHLHEAVDLRRLIEEYPPPPVFFDDPRLWSEDRIRELQLVRLKEAVARAWETDFYRRRWLEAGFEPAMLRSLSDLRRIPPYTVDDIRGSLERRPPWGGHHRIDPGRNPDHLPLRVYFSGGTTGRARPVVFTPSDRAVHSIMQARTLYLQQLRPGDVAINAWSYGLHQAAWLLDEALHRWLSVLPITASTGNVTSSERQVQIAHDLSATTILTTSDYLLHLARVAEQLGFNTRSDFAFRCFPTAAAGNTGPVERAWGRPAYDCYGSYDLSSVAAECEAKQGLHYWEDAYIVEVLNPETGVQAAQGEPGNLVVTSLYMEAFPIIRYNTLDLSRLVGRASCPCGLELAKIGLFEGRSDTMVKLRGINVWPEAVGRVVADDARTNGEYVCVVERINEREEMTVRVEVSDRSAWEAVRRDLEARLKSETGIRLRVEPLLTGALTELTGRGRVGKLRRLIDLRGGPGRKPD